MKKLLALLMVIALSVPVGAQQLNVGLSKRLNREKPVLDAVLMAPQIGNIIAYGQVSALNRGAPELSLAGEIPLINTSVIYVGFDNGLGWFPVENKYNKPVWFTGFTTWIPVKNSYGVYGMFSVTPNDYAKTTQFGLYKQVF